MLENLPWIIGGLVVGLFVGYAFGKYKGASEVSEGFDVDEAIAQATGEKKAPSSQANAEATEKVFVRRGGSHYHKEGCRHLRNRGGQAIPKAQAVKKGFRRCPSCRP